MTCPVACEITIRQAQDLDGFRIGPVVDDIHQQVGIRLGIGSAKKFPPTTESFSPWGGRDFCDDVRLIEQNPLYLRRVLENGAEQVAASAGDVRDGCKLREIVSWQGGGDIAVRFRYHRRVEDSALFRVLGWVGQNAAGVSLAEGGFAGAQRVIKIFAMY